MMGNSKINPKIYSALGQGGSMFGITLPDVARKKDNVIVLSADMSTPAGLDKFKSLYPDKFFNLGIAEQNMIGVAAGLTDEGYKTISVARLVLFQCVALNKSANSWGICIRDKFLWGLVPDFR